MFLFWITLVVTVIGSKAAGEFNVLHSPVSVAFKHTDKTLESFLKEIFSAALGLSVEQNSEWKGMSVRDPFNTPEAVVEVYIDGASTFGEINAGLKTEIFPLIVDEYEPDTFKGVKLRIKHRFDTGGNKIVNIKLSDENMLNTIRYIFGDATSCKTNPRYFIHLKRTEEEDRLFLSELETLRAVIGRVQRGALTPDNLIDFYSFRFRTLHSLSDFYGPGSLQTKEAKKLLGVALQDLSKAFVKAYDGSVLVTVVTTAVAHTRRSARSLTVPPEQWQEPTGVWHSNYSFRSDNSGKNTTDLNANDLADNTAIFNILLWFGVSFAFVMMAIIHACMDMDPGRDSIIYRMTTMRTKKDI